MNKAVFEGETVDHRFLHVGCAVRGIDLQAAGVAAAGIGGEFYPSPDQLGTFFSASTAAVYLARAFSVFSMNFG